MSALVALFAISFVVVYGTDVNEERAIEHALLDAEAAAGIVAIDTAADTLPRKRQLTFSYFGGDDGGGGVAPSPPGPPTPPTRFNYFE